MCHILQASTLYSSPGISLAMLNQLKYGFLRWTREVKHLLNDEYIDLEPHEYCIGAVFIIAIGFVLLGGRR
jgi:hypothetical protein